MGRTVKADAVFLQTTPVLLHQHTDRSYACVCPSHATAAAAVVAAHHHHQNTTPASGSFVAVVSGPCACQGSGLAEFIQTHIAAAAAARVRT